MKSGLICALAAFKALLETPSLHDQLGHIVAFAATVDEEGAGDRRESVAGYKIWQKCWRCLLGEPYVGR